MMPITNPTTLAPLTTALMHHIDDRNGAEKAMVSDTGGASRDHVIEIVAAFVAHNQASPSDLPALIRDVRTELSGAVSGETVPLADIVEIVAAFVSKNAIGASEVPGLIRTVRQAFGATERVSTPQSDAPSGAAALVPAVPMDEAKTANYIVCLVCGRKLKSLGKHLAVHDLTPSGYREKFNLPRDYSLQCEDTSNSRSRIAISREARRKALASSSARLTSTP